MSARQAVRHLGRRLLRDDRGSPALEIGFVMLFILVLLAAVLSFGLAIFQTMEVADAVEAGAAYSAEYAQSCCSSAAYQTAVTTVVQNATGLGNQVSSVTPTPFCGCPNTDGSGNPQSPPGIVASSPSTLPCSTTPCYTGGPQPGVYLRLSGSYTVVLTNIVPWNFLPSPLVWTETVRVQ